MRTHLAVVWLLLTCVAPVSARTCCAAEPQATSASDAPRSRIALDNSQRQRCLEILRAGMRGEEFWPAIHAAEALTLAGHGREVREFLAPKLDTETDDQQRCGLARELVRAGDRRHAQIMLDILVGDDSYGHVHAAESLYKVEVIGDGRAMRHAMAQNDNLRWKLMAAAALARCGNRQALGTIREHIHDADPEISRIATWILGRIGDSSDIPAMRENLKSPPDSLYRAYNEHSLAALGDTLGVERLLANLEDADPAIRTYAATFAGDAWAVNAASRLLALLDDENVDVRVRAAQSLLFMSGQRPADRDEDVTRLVYAATEKNPRYTEGSVLELADGSLLYAVTEFADSGSDFAKARLVARRSTDGGRSWGPPRVLQESTGKMNVMSVTLRRLGAPAPAGTVAMFYLEKNDYDNLHVYARFSQDEAATFGDPVRVTTADGYHVLNNDRVTQLSTGRILVPVASTKDVRTVNHFVSYCWISDDGGQTWRKGRSEVDLPKRGAMEPEVVELRDGRVLMIVRTQLGYIATSYSSDGGDTWSEPSRLSVTAPEPPSTIRRIPATGDLLLIWNNTFADGADHGGKRTPLSAAISRDDGQTWEHVRNLESDPSRTYSYTSVAFVGARVALSYWESDPATNRLSNRFRSLPTAWFTRPDDRWQSAMEAFERQDREQRSATGGVVFVGSSSVRLWKLDESFPGVGALNRGFGGSQIADSIRHVDLLVLKHEPRVVVVYAGDNDIAAGKSPAEVSADYQSLVDKIHRRSPQTKIVFVGVKPSLKRWALVNQVREANRLIQARTQSDPRLVFVDVDQPMIGDDGMPRAELFAADGLHLSPQGYALWNSLVAPHLR